MPATGAGSASGGGSCWRFSREVVGQGSVIPNTRLGGVCPSEVDYFSTDCDISEVLGLVNAVARQLAHGKPSKSCTAVQDFVRVCAAQHARVWSISARLQEHYKQSGRRDSNPRHSAWKADALPLSYARASSNHTGIMQPTANPSHGVAKSRSTYLMSCRLWAKIGSVSNR